MNSGSMIEVTDRDGWTKGFPLEKDIVHIGSDQRNDIVLERARGNGVAPRHLQLILLASQGYRLVNLADTDVLLGELGEVRLAPRSFAVVADGQRVRVGDFTLVLQGLAPRQEASASDAIGLRLALPQTHLAPDQPLEGMVIVRNQGDKTGAQFKLEVEGLDPKWYEVGPGPILFPNAEKAVPLRLHHPKGPRPPAGEHQFSIRAAAPAAYPGQSAVVSQVIEIAPYFQHSMRLVMEEWEGR